MLIKIINGIRVIPQTSGYMLASEDFVIDNGIIKDSSNDAPDQIVDAGGRVIIGGLVNAHHHFYSALAKGLAVQGPIDNFSKALEKIWWKLDRVLMIDDVMMSTITSVEESIKHGVTTIFDHHCSFACIDGVLTKMGNVMRGYGLNGVLCHEMSDRYGKEIFEQSLAENIRYIKEASGSMQGMLGLHAAFTLSDASLEKIGQADADSPVHVHVAEAGVDNEYCKKKYGISALARLNKYGLLRKNSLVCHANHLPAEDKEMLIGKWLVQCIDSNLNNALYPANLDEHRQKGMQVLGGTDGMHSNVLKSIKNSFLHARYLSHDANTGFELADAMYRNQYQLKEAWGYELGLRNGEKADIVITDYIPYAELHADNFLGHLIYGISEQNVQHVIKGDKILMQDGELCNADYTEFKKEYLKDRKLSARFASIND